MKRVLLLLLLAGFSFADSLSVEKFIERTGLSAGDNVQVLLKFSNPFGRQLPIKIVDRDILGGNGIDIQCFEYALPADRTTTIGYEPIQSFQAGSFTLDKAKITYTDPRTGKEETVESNSLEVTIKPSGSQGAQQGITTIYQCGGTSIRSTSFTSSAQPQQSQSQQTQDKLQGMQQQNMQDMSPVKQQMEQQQQQENQLKNRIEQNPEFKKMQEELQGQGYSLQRSRIDPEPDPQSSQQGSQSLQSSQSQNSRSLQSQQGSQPNSQSQNPQDPASQSRNPRNPGAQQDPNSQAPNPQPQPSASFQYDFQKPAGGNATIQGRVENGNVTGLSKWSAEDEKALSDKITRNPRFQQLSRSLQEQGFNRTGQKLSPPSGNLSRFTYSFSNLNETRNITGTATPQGNITSIRIGPNKGSDLPFWLSLLLLLLLAYVLHPKKPLPEPPQGKETRISPRKEALAMIAQAERLFPEGKQKEAFALLSEAVRFYFKHSSEAEKKELSAQDVLKYLKKHGRRKLKPAHDCLGLCDLVLFARFSPDAGDFSRAAMLAKKLVSK